MNDQPKPFTPDALAERWGVSAATIRKQCDRGTIPHFRLGEHYRIPADVVDRIEVGNISPIFQKRDWPSRIPYDLHRAFATQDEFRTPASDQDRWGAIREWLEKHGVEPPEKFPQWPEPEKSRRKYD